MKKKLLSVALATIIAVMAISGASLAWLLDESNVVTNTFTYGEITITLTEENKTNETGIAYTNVVPGDVLKKDPIVTVEVGSEACYVYVLITNDLGTAASYNIGSDWVKIGENGNSILYRYTVSPVDATGAEKDLAVFTELTFSGDLKVSDVEALAGKNVVIKAYAHQSDYTTIAVADAAAIAWADVTPTT